MRAWLCRLGSWLGRLTDPAPIERELMQRTERAVDGLAATLRQQPARRRCDEAATEGRRRLSDWSTS
jgi:hypothetical protein